MSKFIITLIICFYVNQTTYAQILNKITGFSNEKRVVHLLTNMMYKIQINDSSLYHFDEDYTFDIINKFEIYILIKKESEKRDFYDKVSKNNSIIENLLGRCVRVFQEESVLDRVCELHEDQDVNELVPKERVKYIKEKIQEIDLIPNYRIADYNIIIFDNRPKAYISRNYVIYEQKLIKELISKVSGNEKDTYKTYTNIVNYLPRCHGFWSYLALMEQKRNK